MADTVRNGLLLFMVFVAVSSVDGSGDVVCPDKKDVECTLKILYEGKDVSCDTVPDMNLTNPPAIKWPGWSSTATNTYVLLMLDPDIPGTCQSNTTYYLHWLVELQITSADGNAEIKKTVMGGEYQPPTPPENQTHRYQFHLYQADNGINSPFAQVIPNRMIEFTTVKTMFNFPEVYNASFQFKYSEAKSGPAQPTPTPTPTSTPTSTPTPAPTKAPPASNCAAQCSLLLWNFLLIVFLKYSICLLP